VTLSALTFRWHRWLGWIVGLQVMVWVVGGVVFSIVPFKAWVKGGDAVVAPPLVLPTDWAVRTAPALQAAASKGEVTSLSAVSTPMGPALKLQWRGQKEPLLLPADGRPWQPPDDAAIRRFAQGFLIKPVAIVAVERVAEVPVHLGIVAETGGRGDLWRVRLDDGLGTRLYFRGTTGEFVAVRNEAWVWYDFFWRLHIMDYAEGEDFNGWLLRAAAVLALGLVAAGAVLGVLALRRHWRVARRHRAS
jgi:hypothetical protein